jgi:hypothetical protein
MSDGPAMIESNEGILAPVLSSVMCDLPLTMPIADVGMKIDQPTIKDIAAECILQFYKVMLARMWQLRSKCLACMITRISHRLLKEIGMCLVESTSDEKHVNP